ncbi:MAG: hypothetical protein RRC34_10095 [Lentisphaeria bacterium]|nr:hypothetical protein [Lentisphaeria bacterium]
MMTVWKFLMLGGIALTGIGGCVLIIRRKCLRAGIALLVGAAMMPCYILFTTFLNILRQLGVDSVFGSSAIVHWIDPWSVFVSGLGTFVTGGGTFLAVLELSRKVAPEPQPASPPTRNSAAAESGRHPCREEILMTTANYVLKIAAMAIVWAALILLTVFGDLFVIVDRVDLIVALAVIAAVGFISIGIWCKFEVFRPLTETDKQPGVRMRLPGRIIAGIIGLGAISLALIACIDILPETYCFYTMSFGMKLMVLYLIGGTYILCAVGRLPVRTISFVYWACTALILIFLPLFNIYVESDYCAGMWILDALILAFMGTPLSLHLVLPKATKPTNRC